MNSKMNEATVLPVTLSIAYRFCTRRERKIGCMDNKKGFVPSFKDVYFSIKVIF